jgi:hypothetical protein
VTSAASVVVKVTPDTSRVSEVLRIIARHATACADELDALARAEAAK